METAITVALIAAAITLFGIFAKHRLDIWRDAKNERVKAAKEFRATINPDFIGDLHGHFLETALFGATTGSLAGGFRVEGLYFKHRRAVKEFRHYLGPIDKFRLDCAWKAYYGCNEDYPDLFAMYCLPQDGPVLLKHRLETLRNVGSHA